MKRFKTPRGNFFLLLAIAFVVVACFLLNWKIERNRPKGDTLTAVQNVLLRDLDKHYPPTPKEVVKYYSEITKCFYNETYTEEELHALAAKAKELYDDELAENKDNAQYLKDLKSEITAFKESKRAISDYATSPSTDVNFFQEDGYDFARLYCTYYVRKGTAMEQTDEVFLLRLDEKKHWKIYGWDLADKEQ